MKNPTEELTSIYFITLVVGYFACAQYDVKSPIGGIAATSPTRRTRPFCRYRDISPVSAGEFTPKEEAKFVIASEAKQSPGRVKVYGVYFPFFFRGIAAALRASQ